jgi:Cu+-exporting ATPase
MKQVMAALILGLIVSLPLSRAVSGEGGELEVELSIQGMTCSTCVISVAKALQAVEGVTLVKVDLEEGMAEIRAKKEVDPNKLVEAVKKAGFEARIEEIEYKSS